MALAFDKEDGNPGMPILTVTVDGDLEDYGGHVSLSYQAPNYTIGDGDLGPGVPDQAPAPSRTVTPSARGLAGTALTLASSLPGTVVKVPLVLASKHSEDV